MAQSRLPGDASFAIIDPLPAVLNPALGVDHTAPRQAVRQGPALADSTDFARIDRIGLVQHPVHRQM
jgi:hypothetical protein